MPFRLLALIASLWVCVSTPEAMAGAAMVDGNKLHEACQTNGALALMFSLGVVDEAAVFASLTDGKYRGFCIPDGVKASQIRDIACQHLATHPERRQNAAAFEVAKAIYTAFPCPTP